MTPEKIDTITDAAYIQRIRAAAIEAKFIEQKSFQRLSEQFELSGFNGYASLTFKKGSAECVASFDDAPPPVRSMTANLYRDENDNLMSRDYIVTKISWTSYGSRDLAHAADMLDVLTDALEFAKKLGEPCFVTKLLQTKEERVAAENACAKEALISAAEFAARQTFARKRRTQIKIVWSLAELSKQCASSDFAPDNAVAQLRKNKIDTWTHTFTIDNNKIEISIVMTPSSITFITTKIA
jgi:hypothetical protein